MSTLAPRVTTRTIGPHAITVHSVFPAHSTSAPPLLFIPGAAHNHHIWHAWQEHLARHGIESHALSLSGHHPSGGRIRTARLAGYVADIRVVVEALGLSQLILVGHSYGGVIAQCYARRYPVHALALIASWSPRRVLWACLRASRAIGKRHPLVLLHSMINFEALFNHPACTRALLLGEDAAAELVDWTREQALCQETRFILLDMARLAWQQRHPLQTSRLFLIRGAADVLCSAEDLAALGNDHSAPTMTLPGLPHDLMLIQPEVGAQALCSFVLNGQHK
jgi:pimeloyl-ACP methyl ester carboxylesterase